MRYMYTSYRFLVFLFFQLRLNQRVRGVEVSSPIDTNSPLLPVCHCFESSGVGVQGQQPEPHLQVASIVQYPYFGEYPINHHNF